MKTLLRRFLADGSGTTAIEYALIAALVCLAPMAAFGAGGEALAGLIDQAAAGLVSAGQGSGINVLP